MESHVLQLVGVYKSFGKVVPVDGISLDVREGEFLVILGPSGSGKSTLLRLIAGLEHADAGMIVMDGKDVTHVPAYRRDCAFVFQHYGLFPHLTVLENIAYGLRRRGVAREQAHARAREVAELLGLTELLYRRPRQLSGGQRQRVALGRALARKPRLFLFDEPLSALDAKLRVQMRAELLRLHRQLGTTSIFVTHDQVEAMTMGDRVIVMHDGRLQQVGTALEVYRRPCNPFVAGFVGSPPMNLLQGVPGAGERLCGIRSEHIRVTPPEAVAATPGNGYALLEGVVDLVEVLGADALAHVNVGGQRVIARVDPLAGIQVGMRVGALLDLAQASWFDPATGVRLDDDSAR